MNVTSLADTIWRELSEPCDESISSIAFWLQSNIGQAANLLSTTFTIDPTTLEIEPELNNSQLVIYKFLYFISYFNRQIQKNLGAGAYASSILEVKEGGRSIKKVSKTEIAKNLKLLVDGIKDQLNDNLYAYNSNNALPYSIDVANPLIAESLLACSNFNYWWKARA